jgi:hypothetical protein
MEMFLKIFTKDLFKKSGMFGCVAQIAANTCISGGRVLEEPRATEVSSRHMVATRQLMDLKIESRCVVTIIFLYNV